MSFTTDKPRRTKWLVKRICLGLLTLALLSGVIAGLTIWYILANRVTATTIFRVSPENPAFMADEPSQRRDEWTYEVLKKSQLAAIRSYFVLTAAVRKPGIASLSTFAGIDKPEEWLEEHLEAEYPQDGAYLSISISGPEAQSDDLVLIVNAVGKAYQDEVIYKEKARQLSQREFIRHALEKLNKEIAQKSGEFHELVQWIKSIERHGGEVLEQPGVIWLDLIIPRSEQPSETQPEPDAPNGSAIIGGHKQPSDIHRREQGGESKQLLSGDEFAELSARKRELTVLEKIAEELSEKLKRLDMETGVPSRVELVQPGMIDE
jgi:hypothetical protein